MRKVLYSAAVMTSRVISPVVPGLPVKWYVQAECWSTAGPTSVLVGTVLSVYVEDGYCDANTAAVAAVKSAGVSNVHESTPVSPDPAPEPAVTSAVVDAELFGAGGFVFPALVALPPQPALAIRPAHVSRTHPAGFWWGEARNHLVGFIGGTYVPAGWMSRGFAPRCGVDLQ